MTAADVFEGRERYSCGQGRAEEFLAALPERCVDLVLTSPPYEAQRTYGVGFKLQGQAWVDWMDSLVVEEEAGDPPMLSRIDGRAGA